MVRVGEKQDQRGTLLQREQVLHHNLDDYIYFDIDDDDDEDIYDDVVLLTQLTYFQSPQ